MVDVREVSPPPEDSQPVHWRLLTTHQVSNLGEARRIVDLYRMRWTIEEYFRTLKTGSFNIEDADIGDPQVMMKLVIAAAITSVTVMQLSRRAMARQSSCWLTLSIRKTSLSSRPSRFASRVPPTVRRTPTRKVRCPSPAG
jgi:hypothetical protein